MSYRRINRTLNIALFVIILSVVLSVFDILENAYTKEEIRRLNTRVDSLRKLHAPPSPTPAPAKVDAWYETR